MAATLVASWALEGDIERRFRVPMRPRRGRLTGRAARLLALTVLGAAIVAAGTLGVVRWRAHRFSEAGVQLLGDGNPAAAVRTLVNVLAARPDDARVHYYLGEAYARLGVSQAAMTHLKEAVRLAPDEATFRRGLGVAYRREGDTGRARSELETAVRLEPAEPEHRITLAGALIDSGEVKGAVEHLRRVAEVHPGSPSRILIGRRARECRSRSRGER